MPDSRKNANLVTIVDAVIDGRLSAKDAGSDTPTAIQSMFGIAEKLGRLERGKAVIFDPEETALLFEILNAAADLALTGKPPEKTHEKIARRISDLDDPMSWAFNLNFALDSGRLLALQPVGENSAAGLSHN